MPDTTLITPASRNPRGFFGVGVWHAKYAQNVGTLWRSAYLYGAAFIFTVGRRYKPQSSDTPNTPNQIPLWEFPTIEDLVDHLPRGCPLVAVELSANATPLREYQHPRLACYLLGAEDRGLPPAVLDRCHGQIIVETPRPESMNVAVAGSLVMHDRYTKHIRNGQDHAVLL